MFRELRPGEHFLWRWWPDRVWAGTGINLLGSVRVLEFGHCRTKSGLAGHVGRTDGPEAVLVFTLKYWMIAPCQGGGKGGKGSGLKDLIGEGGHLVWEGGTG
jgi:hypothetical protein